MEKKGFVRILLALLLIGALTFTIRLHPVKAEWTGVTIYIKADGSIEPFDAPIVTYDNVTYILTDNVTSAGHGIIVERSNIIIDGANYTIQGPGSNITARMPAFGIILENVENITIKNVRIINFIGGIGLRFSSNNTIVENIIADNAFAITMEASFYNNISKNEIACSSQKYYLFYPPGTYVTLPGIILEGSSHNVISGNNFANGGLLVIESYNNTVVNNIVNGKPLVYLENTSDILVREAGQVILINCDGVMVEGLEISNMGVGIELWNTKNTIISMNDVKGSLWGIVLVGSSDNIVVGNNLVNNGGGIIVQKTYDALCSYNVISRNDIIGNQVGIYLLYSLNNSIYHNNFVDNNRQALILYRASNVWDNGYPSGGNYWSDYGGVDLHSGPYQNETGSDGIGDTPYIIGINNVDRYPLMEPYDTMPPVTVDDYNGLWRNSNFTITLTATDNETGVAETYYRINNGSIMAVGVDGQPLITVEGDNNTLEYWSVDNAGNEELHHILSGIKLDKTPPSIQLLQPSAGEEIRSSTVTVSWSGSDELSGVSRYEARLDGGSWIDTGNETSYTFAGLADGEHTVTVRAVDVAGNLIETSVQFTVNTSLLGGPGWTDDTIVFSVIAAIIIGAAIYLIRARRH